MRRTFIVFAAVAGAVLTLGAGMPGAPLPSPTPGQLRMTVATLGTIGSLDPRHGDSVIAREVWNLQYPTLTALNSETLAPTAGLAGAWSPLPRGNGWRYSLRPSLTWSDGRPVTAADVVYSLDHARDERWPYARATIRGLSGLSARVVDAHTIDVTARTPGVLPGLLLHVVPAHVYSKSADIGANLGALGVADGPWHVVATASDSVMLDVLGAGGPPLGQIAFRTYANADALITALAHGQADVISGLPAADANRLETTPKVTVNHAPDGTEYVLRLASPLATQVRRVVSLAIDREALVADAVYGVGTPVARGTEPPPPTAALLPRTFAGTVTLSIPADATGQRVGAFVRTSLTAAGLKVRVVAAAHADIELQRVVAGNQPPDAIGLFEPDTLQAFRSDHVTGFLREPSQRSLIVFGPTVAQYGSIVAAAQPPGEQLSTLTYVIGAIVLLALCGVAYWLASLLRRRFVPEPVSAQ